MVNLPTWRTWNTIAASITATVPSCSDGNGETVVVPINSVLCANNGDVLREAALNGQGITKLPTFLIGPDLRAGRLRLVLPEFPPTELGIYALYAPNRYLAAKSRLLIDHLVATFGQAADWDIY